MVFCPIIDRGRQDYLKIHCGLLDTLMVLSFFESFLRSGFFVTRGLRRDVSSHVRVWIPDSWVLESGIQLMESGIPLKIQIQNPSFTDKFWNLVPGIQNPRLSWTPLHGARRTKSSRASRSIIFGIPSE